MKKIFSFVLMALLSMFTIACGDDDPTGNPDDYGMSFPKSYVVDYHVKANDFDNTSDVAGLRVKYYDANGNIQQEDLTTGEWTKQVAFTIGEETKIGMRAEWVLKSHEEINAAEKDEYDLTLDITSLYVCEKRNGTTVTSTFFSKQNVFTNGKVSKDKLLELTGNPHSSFLFVFKTLDNGAVISSEESF
ncbi:MAG: hypothetical protein IKT00_14725 [Prevotella sp.]|nr:hypothetical protein [Prevotella sp.]